MKITMLKRAFCLLMVVALSGVTASAEYLGTFSATANFNMTVIAASGNTGGTSTTVYLLGKGISFELMVTPAASQTTLGFAPPRGTVRMVIEVDPPPTGSAIVSIDNVFSDTNCSGHCRFVMDLR